MYDVYGNVEASSRGLMARLCGNKQREYHAMTCKMPLFKFVDSTKYEKAAMNTSSGDNKMFWFIMSGRAEDHWLVNEAKVSGRPTTS